MSKILRVDTAAIKCFDLTQPPPSNAHIIWAGVVVDSEALGIGCWVAAKLSINSEGGQIKGIQSLYSVGFTVALGRL